MKLGKRLTDDMESLAADDSASATDDGCRCMDDGASLDVLNSLQERLCTTRTGDRGFSLRENDRCVPLTYGAKCAAHDAVHNPAYCEEAGINCYRPWCYVTDRDACMASSTQRVYRSPLVTAEQDGIDLFWSYTVCDGLDDWDNLNVRKQTLGGTTILATTPQAYFPPYHYKRNEAGDVLSEPGEEYWNKSVPFEGAMVDYLDELQTLADGDFDIEWTHGSRASSLVHPSSAYTAVVQDVHDGLVDVAVGPIWVTGERLSMSTYTVPLFYSPTTLIAPAPKKGEETGLGAQSSKVFAPFETGVWIVIVFIIIFTAVLSTWFSGESDERLKNARLARRRRGRGEPKQLNSAIWGRLSLDACLRTGTYFFSAGVEQDHGAGLPTKLLLFGFSFFILVVVSAYVANLAAFLTQSSYDYVGTIEEATKRGWKICALPATKEELRVAWPDTYFVFSGAGAGSYHGLVEDWDAGKCKAIVYGFANLDLKNQLCERKLVITNSVVLENPVAWPIRPDYAAGLSYWIYEADKKHGLKVESLKEDYDARAEQPTCDVKFSPQEGGSDEYTQVSIPNLVLPFLFWGSFACVAFGLQIYVARMRRSRKRGSLIDATLIGRNSNLCLTRSFTTRELDVKDDLDTSMDLQVAMDEPTGGPNVHGPNEELRFEGTSDCSSEDENIIAQDDKTSEMSKEGNGELGVF